MNQHKKDASDNASETPSNTTSDTCGLVNFPQVLDILDGLGGIEKKTGDCIVSADTWLQDLKLNASGTRLQQVACVQNAYRTLAIHRLIGQADHTDFSRY